LKALSLLLLSATALAQDGGIDDLAACRAGLSARGTPYSQGFENRSSVASTKLIFRIFSEACHARFPELAVDANQASRVGRAKRSKILAIAANSCPAAVAASTAAEVVATCPTEKFRGASATIWPRLDAGTYAFLLALERAGLDHILLEELLLQSSLHPERDR